MGSINVKPASVIAAEQVESNRIALKATRDTDLKAITHTLAGGAVVQVRPEDLSNLKMAINEGLNEDWVMDNNDVRELTVADMEECLLSGIAQGKVVWKTYTDALKLL